MISVTTAHTAIVCVVTMSAADVRTRTATTISGVVNALVTINTIIVIHSILVTVRWVSYKGCYTSRFGRVEFF